MPSFITRHLVNNKFRYKSATEGDKLRIKSLRIPPMWTDVRIDKSEKAKIQAIGYDAKGRKQYIYHKDFVEKAKRKKFKKMKTFDYEMYSRVLRKYISRKDLSRDCVVANVIKIMEDLCIRPGGDAYEKENGSHGVCTMLKIHYKNGKLTFVGKKGITHDKTITNPKSMDFISRVLKISGTYLFYDASGSRVHSSDLNEFLRTKVQSDITCKDIRTYCANKIFRTFMDKSKKGTTEKERKSNVIKGIDHTAEHLGNTRKVCKDSYLCPNVISKYM